MSVVKGPTIVSSSVSNSFLVTNRSTVAAFVPCTFAQTILLTFINLSSPTVNNAVVTVLERLNATDCP